MATFVFGILETIEENGEKFHTIECNIQIEGSNKYSQTGNIVVREAGGAFFPSNDDIKKFPVEIQKSLKTKLQEYMHENA